MMNDDGINKKRFFASWSCGISNYVSNSWKHKKSTEQLINDLNIIDETVSVMSSYPTAERMLSELWNKHV